MLDVDDYCSATSPPIRGIVFPLREASEEGNGVTSTKNKVFQIRGATDEGNGVTSISETSRICGGSDIKSPEYVEPPRRATV
jgi:hypothetical protein